jgi:hypothetical protein
MRGANPETSVYLPFLLSTGPRPSRVARWHIFKPKIPIWVNFEGLAMENVGILYGHLVYILYHCLIFLWPFGIFFSFWYVLSRKIWQP